MLLNRAVVTTFAAFVPFILPMYAIGVPGPIDYAGPRRAQDRFADIERPERTRSHREPVRQRLSAYRGLAAWIDIYNEKPWRKPGRAVARMKRRGVRALFLQTANYGLDRDIYKPQATARLLRAAHKRDIKVVAWYVPSFAHPHMDLKRSMAAVRFRTTDGHRFDSFAMDIEATVVRDIRLRNRRLSALSRKLRAKVGRRYPLGAIVPDVGSTYWPSFPYRNVGLRYDVFLPMAYYTFRTTGFRNVMDYTGANIRKIRRLTGKRRMPVHMIGGLAGSTSIADLRGFLRGVKRYNAIGASLYDFPITDADEWKELSALSGNHPPRAEETKRSRPKDHKAANGKRHTNKTRAHGREGGKRDRRSRKHGTRRVGNPGSQIL